MLPSRGFDPLRHLCGAEFAVVSWNANALAIKDMQRRAEKRKVLQGLLASNAVVCMQEVHGGEAALDTLFPETRIGFWSHCSGGANHATGGVATLIKKSLFPSNATCDFKSLLAGRILLSWVKVNECTIWFLNLHIFGVSDSGRQSVLRELRPILADCERAPSENLLFIMGDVNLLAEDEAPYDVRSGALKEAAPDERRKAELWEPLLG